MLGPGATLWTGREHLIAEKKIFVGNLNFSTTAEQLREALSEVGRVVDVHLPSDRQTGRPRGFAFVEFADASEAAAAIERFDGFELAGRPLRVNPAQARKPRRSRPSPGSRGGAGFDSDEFERPEFDSQDRASERFRSKPKGSRRGVRGKKRSL